MIPQLLFFAVFVYMKAFCRADYTYCYAEDTQPYLNFSTHTAYEFVSSDDGIPPQQGCNAVQVWMVSRHGTRWFVNSEYPGFLNLSSLRDQVVSNHSANRTNHLCAQDLNNLEKFTFNSSIKNAGLLTEQGHKDLLTLGQRLIKCFPNLLSEPYSPEKYILYYDHIFRTYESAVYFAKGLFGLDFNTSLPQTNSSIINLIYPSSGCQLFSDTYYEANRQVASFDKSEWMISLISRVSNRLGFQHNLTLDDILAIYLGCVYYKAWTPANISAWCTAFTRQDLEVMEYRNELYYFYHSGPGNPLTNKLTCSLLKDMMDKFRAVVTQPESIHPSAAFYFSHELVVDMFLVRLGLQQDSLPLTSDNMPYQLNRKFRTSSAIPFAANIIAVLYNCSEGGLKVGFYLQERQIEVPGCGGPLCDLERLDQLFGSLTSNPACTDRSFCAAASGTSLALSIRAVAFIASFCLVLFIHSGQT